MIDQLFVSVLLSLATGVIKDGLGKAFHALVDAEIHQIDLNNLVREPFRTALDHLSDADLEPDENKRKAHVNDARLQFIKANNLDAPIVAARAAAYVGICYHFLVEPAHELAWYQKSLKMFCAMEAPLLPKLRWYENTSKAALAAVSKLLQHPFKDKSPEEILEKLTSGVALVLPFPLSLVSVMAARWSLLKKQVAEIQEYKKAVASVVDARSSNSGGLEAVAGAL